jgi:glycosyltransferase involved in cell wall biosynthesis
MNKTPIITIVTVCLNNKDMLKKTVCSVKAQDYPHIDYLVIDGASTDGTRDFLSNERILRWISEPDSGIYNAMNKGIRMAKGDWVIFMNAGDTFVTSDTISKIFSQGQEADVIYGDVVKDNLIKKAEPPHNGHRMYFCHQSVFVKTICLREFPFDESHRMSADFKQMKQLYLAGKTFLQLDFPIAVFDTSGISNTHRAKGLHDNIQVIRETDNWQEQLRLLPRLMFTYWICKLRGA